MNINRSVHEHRADAKSDVHDHQARCSCSACSDNQPVHVHQRSCSCSSTFLFMFISGFALGASKLRCHFAKVCQNLPRFALASQGEPRRLRASAAPGGLAHAERASNIDMTSAVLGALAHVVVLLLCCRRRRAVRQCERRRRHSRVFVDPGWCPCPGSIPGRV